MPEQPAHAPMDALRAAADAADDAICRRLDHNQVIALVADAVWRLAYERGLREATEGYDRLVCAAKAWRDGDDLQQLGTDEVGMALAAAVDALGPWEPADQPEPARSTPEGNDR